MDEQRLRAWWWKRQGLDGSLHGKSAAEVLERSGSKCLDEMLERLPGVDVTTRDAIEQFLQQFV